MRIEQHTSTVTPETVIRFRVVGVGAEQANVRVVGHEGFMGRAPTLQLDGREKPDWGLTLARVPVELYRARPRVRVIVSIIPRNANTPIRKQLIVRLDPGVEVDEERTEDAEDRDPEPLDEAQAT